MLGSISKFSLKRIYTSSFLSLAIIMITLSCDGGGTWNDGVLQIDFIIVDSTGEDYFNSDSTYHYDQVRLYDLQFEDTIILNGAADDPTQLISFGEALNYHEFILRGADEPGRTFPAVFYLDYKNGDVDTIMVSSDMVSSENMSANGKSLSRYYANFPSEYYSSFIFYKD